jgi:hypothetical protein
VALLSWRWRIKLETFLISSAQVRITLIFRTLKTLRLLCLTYSLGLAHLRKCLNKYNTANV